MTAPGAEATSHETRLLERAGAAIVGLDAALSVTFWNPAAERMTGWSAREAVGRGFPELMLPAEGGGKAREEALSVMAAWGEWKGEAAFRRRDGSELHADVAVRRLSEADGAVEGYVAVAFDASARRQAERALRRSQAQIRFQALLLEQVSDSVIAVDDRRSVLYWNKGAERTYGRSAEEAVGRPVDEMIALEGGPEARTRMLAEVDEKGSFSGEMAVRHPDGRLLTLELSVSRVRDADGRAIGYVSIARDVTERRRIQEALAESEERYRTLFDVAPDAALVHADGKVLYLNPAALALFGVERPEEMLGSPVIEVVHPDDRAAVRARIAAMLERGERAPLREERLVRCDGRIVLCEVAAAPVRFGGRTAIVAMARDVSHRDR